MYAGMVSDIDMSNNLMTQFFDVTEENAGEVYSDTLPTNGTRLAQGEEVVAVGVRNAGNVETEATPVITLTPIGGGDSVASIKKNSMKDNISHISTGGGALLEYISKGFLPSLDLLKK